MALPTPLFVPTLNTLLASIRIDKASADTLNEVYRAVRDVRIGLVSELGRDRAFAVKALPYVEEPVTSDEFVREAAVSAETLWVNILLKQRLPDMFMDNSASVNDEFNDEPITRDAAESLKHLDEMKEQLNKLLLLVADEDSNVQASSKASIVGPDDEYIVSDNLIGNPCH